MIWLNMNLKKAQKQQKVIIIEWWWFNFLLGFLMAKANMDPNWLHGWSWVVALPLLVIYQTVLIGKYLNWKMSFFFFFLNRLVQPNLYFWIMWSKYCCFLVKALCFAMNMLHVLCCICHVANFCTSMRKPFSPLDL